MIATLADAVPRPDEVLNPGEPATAEEALAVLISLAERCELDLPSNLVAQQVLAVTEGGDWSLREEALRAIVRRARFAERDGLRVAAAPSGGRYAGEYTLRRKGRAARPYRILLESVVPLVASCDCPDFLRNSLGMCKHVWTVLGRLAARPTRWTRATDDAWRGAPSPRHPLLWHPVRDLLGPGDWLAQLRWDPGRVTGGTAGRAAGRAAARRWQEAPRSFRRGPGGFFELRNTFPDDPRRRLDLVTDLLSTLPARRGNAAPAVLVDPAATAVLSQERARLVRGARSSAESKRLSGELRALQQPLYDYQSEGVRRFLATGRMVLADEMGLGKTAQAIAACHALYRSREVQRGLVIAPASLKGQWLREWRLFTKVPVRIVDGSPGERAACYESQQRGFLIVNYEQLLRDLSLVQQWRPDLVVLDEAQRIKNWATKTALYVKQLDPPYRLVLTGTPLENRLDELASVVEWVDDLALEPKWRLAPWHTVGGIEGVARTGARHLDTLRTRLAGCMVRRQRSQVLDQLPPRTDTEIPVSMTPRQQDEHYALDVPIARLSHAARRRPLTQAEFLRLMQLLTTQRIIANGLAQLRFEEVWPELQDRAPTERRLQGLDSPKLIEFRELVAQLLPQNRKIVVFSQWRRALQLAHWAVSDLLADRGERAVFFTGREPQDRRTANVIDFHDDPTVRLFFASEAGGTGLNLQRAANCCICLELPWNPAVLEQRVSRIYRIGQKQPIDVFTLTSLGSIEDRIAQLVSDKRALARELFDGQSDAVLYEQSGGFMKRLEVLYKDLVPSHDEPDAEELAGDLSGDVDLPVAAGVTDEIVPAAKASLETHATPAVGRDHGHGRDHGDITGTNRLGFSTRRPLLDGVTLQESPDGRIRLEATPEAARTLASLFEGLAELLRSARG